MIRKYRNVNQVVELNLPEDPCNADPGFNFQVKSKYNFEILFPSLEGLHIGKPLQPCGLQKQMGQVDPPVE